METLNIGADMNGVSKLPDGYGVSLDTTIYNLEAIKKAAYKFADRASLIIVPGPGTHVSIVFNFTAEHVDFEPEQIIGDFCNELLDQDLRGQIKKETEPLRNLLLAQAFSRTKLVDKERA